MNTFDLKPEILCSDVGDWLAIDMVMTDWERTSSPLIHWYNALNLNSYSERFRTLELEKDTVGGFTNMSYGLPTAEALRVCKHRFTHDVAKLTVQISRPNVMQVVRDIKVSFTDQLAIIGED